MDFKKSKILHFSIGISLWFFWFLFSFSAKYSKTKCFVTFRQKISHFRLEKHRFKKFENLTFFQGGQQTVFGRKLGSLLLFCIRAKYFKTKCFVTFWLGNQLFQTRKTSIQKSKKLVFFQRGKSMVFGQKLESLFLFRFSAKESKTKCFVTFQIENQPFQTKNTRFKKSKTCIFLNFAFFQKGQSMVFGQKQKSLFLFSFSAKYSKTKCYVSLQKEIQPLQTTKIWI